jgi:hypothetical protein
MSTMLDMSEVRQLVSKQDDNCFLWHLKPITKSYPFYHSQVNERVVTEWREMLGVIPIKWKHDLCSLNIMGLQKGAWKCPQDPSITILPGPCRLLFPLLALGTNVGALTFVWTVLFHSNFASQVLTVYVMNAAAYMTYYCTMKVGFTRIL